MPPLTTVKFTASCDIPLVDCGPVTLCLTSPWSGRTLSGLALARATIIGVNCTQVPVTTGCFTGVCKTVCEYALEIDRGAEFQINPDPLVEGGIVPWAITAADIQELIPYPCLVEQLTSNTSITADWVIDSANVVTNIDAATNTYTVAMPIIDRITSTNQGTVNLDLGILFDDTSSTLSADNTTGTFTFTPATGAPLVVSIGDLMEPHVDGVTITRDGTTGIYSSAGGAGGGITTIASSNNCAIGGVGNEYALKQAAIGPPGTLRLDGAPEHYTLNVAPTFPLALASTPAQITSLGTTPSPYFISTTVSNPSTCRDMRCLVLVSGSIAIQAVPGSGTAILGHTLYLQGNRINDRDGRNDGGWNVSWSDFVLGVLNDHTLPPIYYALDIPANGSRTIGVDFGLSTTFTSTATLQTVSIESRQIAVIGSTYQGAGGIIPPPP